MNLKQQIEADLIESLKEKNELSRSVLRLTLSAIHNAEIEKRGELTYEEIAGLVSREIKQRKEAISEYKKGGREDLALKEQKEIDILLKYLPKQLSEEEIRREVQKVIAEIGAHSMSDIGKVVSRLMPALAGKADGGLVNQITKEELSK